MTAQARRIVVTGGTSEIGLAAACRFAADPAARIVLNGCTAERGEAACGAVRARYPSASVQLIAADVSSPTGAEHLVTAAVQHLGEAIDLLVTAAGGNYAPALFQDLPLPDDVAAASEFPSGPGASHMTGQVLSVNGGISAA